MIYRGVQRLVMTQMNANGVNATVMQQGVISIVQFIRLLVNFYFYCTVSWEISETSIVLFSSLILWKSKNFVSLTNEKTRIFSVLK